MHPRSVVLEDVGVLGIAAGDVGDGGGRDVGDSGEGKSGDDRRQHGKESGQRERG